MLFLNAVELDTNTTVHASLIGDAIRTIGTEEYSAACLNVFSWALDANHWTFFHHTPSSVRCIASASRPSARPADLSIERFVAHCHRLDPALSAASKQLREPLLFNKMDIDDIADPRYRNCFEIAGTKERLSLYSRCASDLYQVSIYRGACRPCSDAELKRFTSLATLIMITGLKHEILSFRERPGVQQLSLSELIALLEDRPEQLSRREAEVCARAAMGMTIEKTADDLDIKPSSVITYRQRAYLKLNIRSQNELVALVSGLRA